MIAIVMPYYNRPQQLNKTLLSINTKIPKEEFVVVVVNDASDENIILPKVSYNIVVIDIDKNIKNWTNPEPVYNTGFLKALELNANIIISQNSECYHIGDIISYAKEMVSETNYLTFSCFSLGKENTFKDEIDIYDVINKNNKCATFDGEDSWYNHPVHRPCCLEFCSAISASNLIKLNGYDESLAFGIGYGDNYLLHRIRLLGLSVEIIEKPFVVHQWHYNDDVRNRNKGILTAKNAGIYNQLLKDNTYKASHIITSDFENIIN